MISETIRKIETKSYTVLIEVVNFCEGSYLFNELYTESEHIAGTTIKAPEYLTTGKSRHYIGQYTPAELSKDYAKQGRHNPSYEAYKNLQDELAHYIQASDCAIKCSVFKAGIELSSSYGTGFDHSPKCSESLEEKGLLILNEYGREFINEAIIEAKEKLIDLAA